MKKVINLLCSCLLLVSCVREKDPVKYAENEANGLRKKVTVGNISYTIQYKPPAYIAVKEHLDKKQGQERIQQLKGMAWFNISFSIKDYGQSPLRYGISTIEEYTARQDYYLNQAAKDIYLLYGKDTLYVNSYWFENNQNLTPYETMIIGFKLPGKDASPQRDMQLSFYDRVFRNGIIKTRISQDDLDNIPE